MTSHPAPDWGADAGPGPAAGSPSAPVDWNYLTAEQAKRQWLALNAWVNWLRRTYGLPASVVPPLWHRHPELVWELSALHTHWLTAYQPDQPGSAPVGWHASFTAAQQRLRDWTAASGTRLDRDRPTRQTVWPGEPPASPVQEHAIDNRDQDFIQFIHADIQARQDAEDAFIAAADDHLPHQN